VVTRIGIDLGGTKIEAVALDQDGGLRGRLRIPTPRADYEATVEATAALVEELEAAVGERGTVGAGTPGAVSRVTGRMKNCNSTWLNGRALREDLQVRLGREVRLANDADCFALSEAIDGAAMGARCVFGAILGTGTGGGVVVDGRLLGGANGIAGEWGHNPLPWPEDDDERVGPACWCGKRGCIETFLSGPGLKSDHARMTGGALLEPEEIVRRAAAGDDACEASLRRYERRAARALASIVNVLDPDVIVLGGGLSNLGRLYQTVPPLLGRWVFSDRIDTPIRPPVHGDASGARGAARLW
jgi:fructokinase